MRIDTAVQTTASLAEVKVEDGQMLLGGSFTLQCPLPEQNHDLPKRVEQLIESGGQELKRCLFRQAMEHADLELLLQQRDGKDGQGFCLRGTKGYTFKTIFGTVAMQRHRVQQKADGAITVPSAQVWQTPDRICVTAGLRAAACDGMRDLSVRDTAAQLGERAGETDLISHTEVLKLVHQEGRHLQQALQARAEEELAGDETALACLLPQVPSAGPADEAEAACAETVEDSGPKLLGFPGFVGESVASPAEQPRQVDAGCVLVQTDEVKVHAQASTGQKEKLVYTALVMLGATVWHLSAATSGALQRQVAGLLATLAVHRGAWRLLFLADGARWIRNWFESLPLPGKAMILCWYHVQKRCGQLLSMACRGRVHREQVEGTVLEYLWHGRVTEAIAALQSRRGEMKNTKALDDLMSYLEQRRAYLPNYAERQAAGLWIASNRVEKFNDWAVSERCKHRGMAWAEGVHALAALETARRNGELAAWRETGQLPPRERLAA